MKVLLMINASPWGCSRAAVALRFALAAQQADMSVTAVYFRGDGVYHALCGQQQDRGADDLQNAWTEFAALSGVDLLLCTSATARRLPASVLGELSGPWREAGLAELMGLIENTDRVMSF